MANKILIVFLLFEFLFLLCGGLMVAVVFVTRTSSSHASTVRNVAQNLLMSHCPLMAIGINAVLIFATFLLSVPALVARTHRLFLKFHGYAIILCALFTTSVGLSIWFGTLKTRSNMAILWGQQSAQTQSLLQQKFQCCGYLNAVTPPFVQDNTCTDALVAANLQGCVTPFSNFANGYLDIVFTSIFGIAAFDFILLLSTACLFKDRKERERFQLIDAKSDFAPI